MSDLNTPDQQETPGQQATVTPSTTPTENWEARYKGSVAKVEELTLNNRKLEEQLRNQASETERLKTELGTKSIESDAAVSERDKKLQELVERQQEASERLQELEALALKVEVANEIGRPEILQVAQHIPNVSDPEVMKSVISDFADVIDSQLKQREETLMAGVTPGVNPAVPAEPTLPTSDEGWSRYVEGLPLGSDARSKAMDQWYRFLQDKHKQ